MYVEAMNAEELVREFGNDSDCMMPFIQAQIKTDFRRYAAKTRRIPVVKMYDKTLKNGNKYIIILGTAQKYRADRGWNVQIGMFALLANGDMLDANGIRFGGSRIVNGKLEYAKPTIFTLHYMNRYHERYGLDEKYHDIYHQFIARYTFRDTYYTTNENLKKKRNGSDVELVEFWKDGISLGINRKDGVNVMKTFMPLSADFTNSQFENYSELLKKHYESKELYDKLNSQLEYKTIAF